MTCTCDSPPPDERGEHQIGCPEHEFPLTQAEIRQVRTVLAAVDGLAQAAGEYVANTMFAALGMIPLVGSPISAPESGSES